MEDASFAQEIANLNAEVGRLSARNTELRRKYEADQVQMARYFHLIDQRERLEREKSALSPGHTPTGDYEYEDWELP